MSVTLQVDFQALHTHLAQMADQRPGLIPVAKGNGYGLGMHRLAELGQQMKVSTMAVGAPGELPALTDFDGDIVVLEPWRLGQGLAANEGRIIRTIGDLDTLAGLRRGERPPRMTLKLASSMRRFGIRNAELRAAAAAATDLNFEAFSMHLPLANPDPGEVERSVRAARSAGLKAPELWVSHLSAQQCKEISEHLSIPVRPRIGTALWLGDNSLLRVRGQVLACSPIRHGERAGYRQLPARRSGYLLVVDGGTSHGIGLSAPPACATWSARAKEVAKTGLSLVGRSRSPFLWRGVRLSFHEPPHAQVSMVILPEGVAPPEVGEEIEIRTRLTTLLADQVVARES